MLGGFNAQRIDQTINAYQPSFPFGQPFTQVLDPLFTRFEDGVVHLWDNPSNTYDTLMWFDALPGQHWNMHHQDGYARFDVLDTGTTMVAGIPLRFVVVEEPMNLFAMDTVRERIGSDLFYIDPAETLQIDWTTTWLLCYRDDVIDEFHGSQGLGECDFTLSVPEEAEVNELPSPNPGTESLHPLTSAGLGFHHALRCHRAHGLAGENDQ